MLLNNEGARRSLDAFRAMQQPEFMTLDTAAAELGRCWSGARRKRKMRGQGWKVEKRTPYPYL